MLSSPPMSRDDVVAVAAVDDVVAEAALEPVVAAVAEERVVADAGDQDVVPLVGAAEQRRGRRRCSADSWCPGPAVAGLLRMTSGVRMPPPTGHCRVVGASSTSCQRIVTRSPSDPAITPVRIVLLGLVDLEDEAGRREHVRRQMRRVGVAHDHGGEGVVLHLAEQMQAVEALQVVEAVAVLQLLHLHFEDEVEGRAEHAAERHDLLRRGRRSRDRRC